MPALPHDFNQLRTGQRPPFLMAGAGLSWNLVPGPKELIKAQKERAELALKCIPIQIDPESDGALYKWAEDILKQLVARSEQLPKLRLAEAIDLLSDRCWTAGVGLPLRGTTPRHRVIARLARERRWVSAWSFNWDTHIENALEQVGFDRDEPRVKQPWLNAYKTIVVREDFRHLARNDLFCLLKPHGCVKALLLAKQSEEQGNVPRAKELSERLMITKRELTEKRSNSTDEKFFTELRSALNKSPLMVVGWSISEPYLIDVINETVESVIQRTTVEELTIVDPYFNAHGHTKASSCYGLSKEQVFAELESAEFGIGADELFLWLQARYALDAVGAQASESVKNQVGHAIDMLRVPLRDHFLFQWADDFLPAWTRLCWRAELVHCAGYQPHELRLELNDFHIPWSIQGLPRPDLVAAANLLAVLPDDGGGWDFSRVAGALWKSSTGQLVLPLPVWGNLTELAALEPLASEVSKQIGYVTSLDILPVDHRIDRAPVPGTQLEQLKESVARLMRVAQFASSDKIGIVDHLGRSS